MDHVNFLFYKDSPGVPMPNPTDIRQTPDKKANPPEFAWWEFNIDDVTAGAGASMMAITDATDPDLSRFLNRRKGKLLLYHGWADPEGQNEPTLDYYKDVVDDDVRRRCQGRARKRPLVHGAGDGALRRRTGLRRVGPAGAAR